MIHVGGYHEYMGDVQYIGVLLPNLHQERVNLEVE